MLIITFSVGYLMWQFSEPLMGTKEAFDSIFYVFWLAVIGVFAHSKPLLSYIGIVSGQLVYFVMLSGMLWLVGLLFIFLLSSITPVVAYLTSGVIKNRDNVTNS